MKDQLKDQSALVKKPISDDTVFRNMMLAVFGVSTLFFVKNILTAAYSGALVIGICIAIFTTLTFIMKKRHSSKNKQQLSLCLSIVFLVFVISLNSGNYYSDDFPLYLAVIALAGLYLVPKYTLIQAVIIDILLIIAYFVHPEKADPFSQYMMCVILFTVAAFCFYMVIKRGRAYIEIGESRAKEAEKLLEELKSAGEKLQQSCEKSLDRVSKLEEANETLESGISDLREGSSSITQGTEEVTSTFESIRDKMEVTQEHVESLNGEVKNVETSISHNKQSMKEITTDIQALKDIIAATNRVFTTLHDEITEIVACTGQLNKIATNTTTLALNASIEAARAGQAGAGFAVVANKVQLLSEDSNRCSSQIASVVSSMEALIQESASRLMESDTAINHSITSLGEFESSFKELTKSFKSLYQNIEEQNDNIHSVDHSLNTLSDKITDMAASSRENQESVSHIAESMDVYKENIRQIIDDNIGINELSVSLMNSATSEL